MGAFATGRRPSPEKDRASARAAGELTRAGGDPLLFGETPLQGHLIEGRPGRAAITHVRGVAAQNAVADGGNGRGHGRAA